MGKPDVTISAPSVLYVGQEAVIDIHVTAAKETKVEYIDAVLVGEQGWSVGAGKTRVSMRAKWPELVRRVMAEGVLAPGTTQFTTRVTLPPETAPTHRISPAYARMRLRVHVSIPWWPDGRYAYEFPVHVTPPRGLERRPAAIRSTPLDAAPDKPRIELGLASTRLAAGEILRGTCAVFHLDDKHAREVEVSLVPLLELTGRGSTRERRGDVIRYTVTLPAGSAGTSVPFAFRIPMNVTPTFTTLTHGLSWWLNARSGSFFGGKVDVSVPIEIHDAVASRQMPPLPDAPRLGDEQIAAELASFAARAGWTGGDMAVEREIAGSTVQLAYDYRGQHGMFVVSRVDHPSLGLGLSVTPSSSIRHVFFKDVEVDIAPWDRANYVVARSGEQALPFLRRAVPTIVSGGDLGTMLRWTDTEIVFERAVSAVDRSLLAEMARPLEILASAIRDGARLISPAITAMPDVAAWHAFADRLGGELTVGDLSISGTLDGLPVHVGIEWVETVAVALRASVGDPDHASGELRKIDLQLARPASEVMGTLAAEPLVDQVTRWGPEITDLRVRDGVASARLAVAGAVDIAEVQQLVEALRAVLVALDAGAGPYR